ncbi:MAG: phosphatase PAP2 family protein [Ktedonobacterales bacterium]
MPTVSRAVRRCALVVALGAALASYELLNRPTAQVHLLQTPLDFALPVVPLLAFPYVAYLPLALAVLVALALSSWPRFRTLALAFIILCVAADLCYVFFQTRVARPVVPGDDLASQLVRLVYAHDQPFNDLPSQHAGGALMLAVATLRWRRRVGLVVLPLAVAIIASTVLIRQHSLIGAGAGLMLGAACYALALGLEAPHDSGELSRKGGSAATHGRDGAK